MASMYGVQADALEEFSKYIRLIPEQCGAIFALSGTVTGMDLFDHPETFQEVFPKLLQGYALDAIDQAYEEPKDTEKTDAEEFVSQIRALSDEKSFAAIGAGTDIRFQGPRITGSALDALNSIVHLSAFPLTPSSDQFGKEDELVESTSQNSIRRTKQVRTTVDRK
jgi:hypothetical protein